MSQLYHLIRRAADPAPGRKASPEEYAAQIETVRIDRDFSALTQMIWDLSFAVVGIDDLATARRLATMAASERGDHTPLDMDFGDQCEVQHMDLYLLTQEQIAAEQDVTRLMQHAGAAIEAARILAVHRRDADNLGRLAHALYAELLAAPKPESTPITPTF